VLLEADRRNPRRRGIATPPETPAEPVDTSPIAAADSLGDLAA
jgi:hypothetical protein